MKTFQQPTPVADESFAPEPPPKVLGPQPESLRSQLGVLQTRIGLHGSRLWQLPLTYLGVLVVSLSQFDSLTPVFSPWFVFSALAIFGALLLWCMYGALEGYRRTVKHMIRVEKELNLIPATADRISHYVPYFGIMILAILFTLGAAVYFYASQGNVSKSGTSASLSTGRDFGLQATWPVGLAANPGHQADG